jgi:hypothetical protein
MMTAEEYIARFVDAGERPNCEYINGVQSLGTASMKRSTRCPH